MTKGAGRNTAKRTKNADKWRREDAKKLTKRAIKSAFTQGEHAKISVRKALKIHKMPPTKYC